MKKQNTNTTTALSPSTMETIVEYQSFGSNVMVELSVKKVLKWLVKPTRSGKLPSEQDVIQFIMLCKGQGLNPWVKDAFLVGYDTKDGASFSLIIAHQALLKRAEIHPAYDGMESGIIVQKDGDITELSGDFLPNGFTLLGGWAKVYRKDRSRPQIARLNLSVFNKGHGQWNINPAGMIAKCAEADALRQSFPNTLGGLYTDAEMHPGSRDTENDNNIPLIEEKPAIEVITEDQRTSLVRLAQELDMVEALGRIVNECGFSLLAEITSDKFLEVSNAIRTAAEKLDENDSDAIDVEVVQESGPETEAGEDAESDFIDPFETITTPQEKAKSQKADLIAAAIDKYRDLQKAKGEAFAKANKFLGSKGIPELSIDKLNEFLQIDFDA